MGSWGKRFDLATDAHKTMWLIGDQGLARFSDDACAQRANQNGSLIEIETWAQQRLERPETPERV